MTEFLGEGGAGAVYIAEHANLGHYVAVKTLFGKYTRDSDMRRRFIEEAIIQANLNHPNIVKVTDVLDEPALSAIIMEYVDGGSLDRYLAKLEAPDSIEINAGMMLSLLDAMTYAHAQGVVHRDIKPANIMLSKSSRGLVPKVTDFGIAKVLSDQQRTETGTAMGTVYYASPEQLTDAKSVDHRADIYSLGCTFYEMLTRKLPFDDSTMFGVMRKHLQAPRPDPAHLNPEVPREVSAVVMRAMAVKAEHRFPSCAEFAAELRRAIGWEEDAVLPSGSSGRSGLRAMSPSGLMATDPLAQAHANPAPTRSTRKPVHTTDLGQQRRRPTSRTHPGRIDAPPRPQKNTNAVSTVMWVVIGALAVAVVGLLAFGARGDGPTEPAPPATNAVVTPPTAGSGEANAGGDTAEPSGADAEAGEPTPALAEADISGCYDLADRYVEFDPLGAVRLEDAIADLAENTEPCTDLLEARAEGSFESTLAFLSGVQARTVLSYLRAIDAHAKNDVSCPDAHAAITEAHRGLRRVDSATRDGLLDYEISSLQPYRARLTHLYATTWVTFHNCNPAPIDDIFLTEEGHAEVLLAALPSKPEGSGTAAPH